MNNNLWDQDRLQQYITDEIEENLNLDYKAAGALSKNDNKKTEITKDVSAMANSAGGIIIYGIKEYQEKAKKYLPESIDPINRNDISKEWLEQIINNIQPKISGIIIHPVKLDLGDDTVAYVVEIPQSTTAHQAQDKKYYKRFNFSSEPMDDYEIRDIINRAVKPDIEVEIKPKYLRLTKDNRHTWGIEFEITNLSPQVINHFQIVLSIPGINRLYT
ncbi:MAG: ATP-binding protein, partial [Anaerolineales bacterium]|nr:ATP-binding protein [Anaerolineales bacterium]